MQANIWRNCMSHMHKAVMGGLKIGRLYAHA